MGLRCGLPLRAEHSAQSCPGDRPARRPARQLLQDRKRDRLHLAAVLSDPDFGRARDTQPPGERSAFPRKRLRVTATMYQTIVYRTMGRLAIHWSFLKSDD